jgi:hypothetical protein
MKWIFRLSILLLGLGVISADARFPRGFTTPTVAFTHVPLGGTGLVIGMSSLPSANLLLARTDQFNCYISTNNSQWSPLLKSNNTPQAGSLSGVGFAGLNSIGAPVGSGVGDCVAAPSDPTNIWVETNGGVFFSIDSGATWNATCYPTQPDAFNPDVGGPVQSNALKSLSHIIAVDPANPNIVYMGTVANGLYATYDKGATCTHVTAVGSSGVVPNTGGYHGDTLIAFDTSGGTTSTCPTGTLPLGSPVCTKNIYVSTYGTGVYRATDAGVATWTLQNSANMPTSHHAMKADPFGNLWFIDDSLNGGGSGFGTLRKYNGTAWSTPTGAPTVGTGVDVDPNACSSAITCHIAVINGGGSNSGSSLSIDGGTTWNTTTTISTASSAGDVTWLSTYLNIFGQYPTGAAFDNSGHVYSGGEGAFWNTPPAVGGGTAALWHSQTAGIEESLSASVLTTPNTSGKVLIATWDVNCFVQLAMPYSIFPTNSNRGCNSTNGTSLQRAYMADYASTDPSFIISLVDNQGGYGGGGSYINYSGTSADGGATWSGITGPPIVASGVGGGSLKGGCIAASSSTNYVWAPTDGRAGYVPPYYSTDSGATWAPINVGSTYVLNTNAVTASGTTLHFAATVPAGIVAGMSVYDDTAFSVIPANNFVVSTTATTVVLNAAVTGAGAGSGDRIVISGGGWPFQYFNASRQCASDRDTATNPNTFYFYNFNDGAAGSLDRIIKCTSGGASCAVQGHPNLGVNSGFHGQIKTVPGKANNLFLSNQGNSPVDGASGGLFVSTDGGVNTTQVALTANVYAFGFGAAFNGHSYPTIVFAGFYNGVYGIWQSIDWDGAKTWQQIGTYPKNLAVTMEDIDGDKVIPNVFYYTTSSGLFCSAPSTGYCNGGT